MLRKRLRCFQSSRYLIPIALLPGGNKAIGRENRHFAEVRPTIMKPVFRIALVSLIVSCLAVVAMPRPAAAHPLGNFTVNQYSALTVGLDRVDVFYVVDMAEIPAFQELGTIRADHGT